MGSVQGRNRSSVLGPVLVRPLEGVSESPLFSYWDIGSQYTRHIVVRKLGKKIVK
jgi:hypothetical protein